MGFLSHDKVVIRAPRPRLSVLCAVGLKAWKGPSVEPESAELGCAVLPLWNTASPLLRPGPAAVAAAAMPMDDALTPLELWARGPGPDAWPVDLRGERGSVRLRRKRAKSMPRALCFQKT